MLRKIFPLFVSLLVALPVHADTAIKTASTCVSVTPTITAGAYASGDNVGGLLTLSGLFRDSGSALVTSVTITDRASQGADIDAVFYSASVTSAGDNNAYDPSDSDNELTTCYVPVTTHVAFNDNGLSFQRNVGCSISATSGRNGFVQLVARAAPTYASTSDIVLKVCVLQD